MRKKGRSKTKRRRSKSKRKSKILAIIKNHS